MNEMKRKRGQQAPPEKLHENTSSSENTGTTNTDDEVQDATPTKRRRALPPKSNPHSTPRTNGTPSKITRTSERTHFNLLKTPTKNIRGATQADTPTRLREAERSARRKTTRNLIERTITGVPSDEEGLAEEEDRLAESIWENADEEDDTKAQSPLRERKVQAEASTTTPKRKRGRPPKAVQRSPTPPQDLPPHEQYFYQNRPKANKTSNNTLGSLRLLSHDEYFSLMRDYVDPHESDRAFLHELHGRLFNQWRFELSEGFSLCLYGWGSKRKLALEFAEWLSLQTEDSDSDQTPKIVVVNGYISSISIKEILSTVLSALDGPDLPIKLPGQPADMLDALLTLLDEPATAPITLLINSIDAPPLRRLAQQSLLARLAAHKAIHLLATADHPGFPLLWDSNLRESFNFLFRDCTTFDPYDAEVDVVDAVNELLGRTGRRVGGKEGVGYVLRSLPENARSLYRVLVGEQLAGMEDGLGAAGNEDEEDGPTGLGGASGADGVEYRVLYQKAVEEFICSSEVAFRTLLKEFHDHQMITSKKDPMGTEILRVPFGKEELEAILEDLLG